MNKVLNCPHCGTVPRVQDSGSSDPAYFNVQVLCDNCGATSKRLYRTYDEAIAAWNKRAPNFINSTEKISAAYQRYKYIDHKVWKWKSIYNGYLEVATYGSDNQQAN